MRKLDNEGEQYPDHFLHALVHSRSELQFWNTAIEASTDRRTDLMSKVFLFLNQLRFSFKDLEETMARRLIKVPVYSCFSWIFCGCVSVSLSLHKITCSMLGFSNGGLSWASKIGLPICRMDFLNSCSKNERINESGEIETKL